MERGAGQSLTARRDPAATRPVSIQRVDPPLELRQLRYFVAVAEELHFGRAAERLHISQSPLSRAIRELERELGVVLFVRTTRRVELTPAGIALLERARRALVEVDLAIDETRRAAEAGPGVVTIGHGPLSRAAAIRIVEAVAAGRPDLKLRLEEDVTPELLRRVATRELAAAVVFETPEAAHRHRIRIDALRDEPLLAALPATHRFANSEAIAVRDFAAERVLLPREPIGRAFNAWLRAVLLTTGCELDRTLEIAGLPWDRRMLPVAEGEAVAPVVADWADGFGPDVVAVPFDPPISFPIDLASGDGAEAIVDVSLALRDAEQWLSQRRDRAELPD